MPVPFSPHSLGRSAQRPSIAPDAHLRLPEVERAIGGCPDRYFVTLTSKRALTPQAMTTEVSKVLHRVNRRLFGTAYERHGCVRLATLAAQERSFRDGLHTHLLIGVPEGSLLLKAHPCRTPVTELVVETWIAGDPFYRRANGQDARDVYDFSGVRRYISKGIRTFDDFDHLDVLNTHVPYPLRLSRPQEPG